MNDKGPVTVHMFMKIPETTLRPERVWGPKALFEGDDTIMCNRLFQPWEEGRSMFTGIFDDIFADG